jgi:hypothetical protein
MPTPSFTNVVDAIMAFEAGELDRDEVVELFQHLVDTGLAWELQGSYGRTARDLIYAGDVIVDRASAGASHDQ